MGIRFPGFRNGCQRRQPTACIPVLGRERMASNQASDGDRRLLDRPGFAQEFLRRSPRYRSEYRDVMRTGRGSVLAQEVMARRWGLCFPLQPTRLRRDGTRTLAGMAGTDHGHPRYRAARLCRYCAS